MLHKNSLDFAAALILARKIFMTLLLATDPLFEGAGPIVQKGHLIGVA